MNVPPVQPVRGVALNGVDLSTVSVFVARSDLRALEQYPTLLWLLTASGVLDEIGARPVTILAPYETAFRDFAFVDAYGLMKNPTAMAELLRRHVVIGVYTAQELAAARSVLTLGGERLAVWRNGRNVMVNEVTVTFPLSSDANASPDGSDLAGSVVYGIDRVLVFPVGHV
jgi:uncharacterized surface protein with fasciclin (FAS1) repeats